MAGGQYWAPYRLSELGVPPQRVAAAVRSPLGFRTVSLPELEPLLEHDYPLYLTTGVFPNIGDASTPVEERKRRSEDMEAIWALTLDVDLNNWVDVSKAQILGWGGEELREAAVDLEATVRMALTSLGVEPYLSVYSGYGVYLYIALDPEIQVGFRDPMQRTMRAWADAMDTAFGVKLIERGTLDPGTRLSRVIGSQNTKGERSIEVEQIHGRNSLPQLTKHDLLVGVFEGVEMPQPRKRKVIEDRRAPLIDYLGSLWEEGRRHALALAVAAMLAKEGVPFEEALAVIEVASMGDKEAADRVRSVRTTYERVAGGLPVSGWFGVGDVLTHGERDVLYGLIRSLVRQVGTVEFVEPVADVPPAGSGGGFRQYEPCPPEVLRGWLDEYLRVMSPTTEAPAGFHLGVGLTVAGAFLGRSTSVLYGSDILYPNLYVMLVGASGKTRKDSAIRRGISLLRHRHSVPGLFTPSGVSILRDIGSAEGLLRFLADNPSTLLHISELSRLMGNVKREVTRTISPTLMEAWDCPSQMGTQTKNAPVVALEPTLSALAAVQPDVLGDLMSDADIHSGFANRWLFVCGDGGAPKPWPEAVPETSIERLWRHLDAARLRMAERKRPFTLDPAAYERWTAWYLGQFELGGSSEELAMQQRLPVMAVKIAGIYAALGGHDAIEDEDIGAGIAIADWSWRNVRPLIGEWGGNPENRLRARIDACLDGGAVVGRAELEQLTRSRRWSVREFNSQLEAMQRALLIEFDKDQRVRKVVA